MVCFFVPAFGPSCPSRVTNALNNSGCLTASISAQVPPEDHPARPQFVASSLTPKFEITSGTTSLIRWSAA